MPLCKKCFRHGFDLCQVRMTNGRGPVWPTMRPCVCAAPLLFTMLPYRLAPINEGVWQVLDAQGQPVGNLKRIGALWKFKALGYTASGELIPGGGPLTEAHNTVVERVDEALLNAALQKGR